MSDFILNQELSLRLGMFACVFAGVALWEAARPRRARAFARTSRWLANAAMSTLNTLLLRLLFPVLAVGAAVWAQENGAGLFHAFGLPAWAAAVLAVIALDALVYGQHVLFHAVPVLWRVHRVHHTDRDVDVTTAVRFHPLEIAVSMVIKIAAVIALGAPPAAVIVFEVLLNATAMFNHANLRLPAALDRVLRLVMVTPDMHRVHHSVDPAEMDRNFGFNLSCWDRLFGTYTPAPRRGHAGMMLGLAAFQDAAPTRLGWLLGLPFAPSPAPGDTAP